MEQPGDASRKQRNIAVPETMVLPRDMTSNRYRHGKTNSAMWRIAHADILDEDGFGLVWR